MKHILRSFLGLLLGMAGVATDRLAAQEDVSLQVKELRIQLNAQGAVTLLNVGSSSFPTQTTPMGLFVRDALRSDLLPVGLGLGRTRRTELAHHGLRVSAEVTVHADHLLVSGVVEDTRGTDDRGVDVVFRLPFQPAVWWGSISESVPPDVTPKPAAKRPPRDDLPEGAGVLERIERGGLAQDYFPLACVTTPDERAGLALAIPPEAPCRFRFAHLREPGCLELQLLFGLSPAASEQLKSRAPFRFVIYPADGRWGLRDALRQYQTMYADMFQRRAQASGLWLVSLPSLKNVTDPENYAFWQATRLKETPLAIKMGMAAYPYTIVGQRELGYLKQKVSTYADVLAALQHKPEATRRSRYPWEVVKPLVESSGLHDASGKLIFRLRTTDWAGNSISFPVNPSPYLPADEAHPTVASHTFAEVEGELREYPELAGIYVDSLAMWGSYENYRREHFAAIRFPLAHDTAGRVCLPNWMPHVDYLKELRGRIGKRLVFANGARPGRAFCSLLLDIVGMEPSLRDLENRTQIDFLRSMAGPKPAVCLLDYPEEGLSRAQAEQYIQRFVALGLAPEMRRVPWPRYKDRDADLYKRFMPVYRRLDRAGWQPVTHAAATPGSVWGERFGTRAPELYLSLYNPDAQRVEVKLTIDRQALALGASPGLREIVTDETLADLAQPIVLEPYTLRVIQVGQ